MGALQGLLQKVKRALSRNVGEKFVARMADTSSDAPSRFTAPKRDLYEQLQREGKLDPPKRDT